MAAIGRQRPVVASAARESVTGKGQYHLPQPVTSILLLGFRRWIVTTIAAGLVTCGAR
ncbi:hypothetical protein D3C81_1979000 [compost metagenome]